MDWLIVLIIIGLIVYLTIRNSSKSAENETSLSSKLRTLALAASDQTDKDALLHAARYVEQQQLEPTKKFDYDHDTQAVDATPLVAPQYDPNRNLTEPSALDMAALKQKQETRNVNTILYVASFLLVGAAALFIGTALSETLKFIALCLIIAAFYGVGMVLHRQIEKLRPAALAFVGTGLALIPFAGLAFYNYVLPDGPLVWLLTSAVGLVAFLYATMQLRSQVLAYVSVGFIFSLASSSVAVLSIPFVWYFIAIIVTGTILSMIAYRKPALVDQGFHQPVEQAGQLAVPLAVIGSIFMFDRLSSFDFTIVFAVVSLHYAVATLRPDVLAYRVIYWTLARLFAILAALVALYAVTDDMLWVGHGLVIFAAIIQMYSLERAKSDRYEKGWVVGSQVAVALAACLWIGQPWLLVYGLSIALYLSVLQVAVLRRANFGALGLASLVLLPIIIGRYALDDSLSYEILAVVSFVFASLAVGARAWASSTLNQDFRWLASAGYIVFIVETIVLASYAPDQWWIASAILGSGGLLFAASFAEREPRIHVISNILFVVGVGMLLDRVGVASEWITLYTAWLAGAGWYSLRWYFDEQGDRHRTDIMVVSSVVVLLLSSFFAGFSEETVVAGVLTGLAVAGIVAYEGYRRSLYALYESAIVIGTFALQRLILHVYEPDLLVFTHWWAASIALMALMRLSIGDRVSAKMRGIIALSLVTVPSGLAALIDPDTYQLLFLLEHVVLMVAGVAKSNKLVTQWSAIAIGLAVIWLLREYSYVLLALLGLGLIGLAIWRLLRKPTHSA